LLGNLPDETLYTALYMVEKGNVILDFFRSYGPKSIKSEMPIFPPNLSQRRYDDYYAFKRC